MIREAVPSDKASLLRIVDARPTHFVEAAKPLIMRDFAHHQTLIYVETEAVLGFAIWNAKPTEVELLWLAVDPAAGRRGIGRALVTALELQVEGQQRVFLCTATTDSVIEGTRFSGSAYEGTNKFFTALGYRAVQTIPDGWGPGNHCLVMEKRLLSHHGGTRSK